MLVWVLVETLGINRERMCWVPMKTLGTDREKENEAPTQIDRKRMRFLPRKLDVVIQRS